MSNRPKLHRIQKKLLFWVKKWGWNIISEESLKEYCYPGKDNSSIHSLNTYCWPSKCQTVLGCGNSPVNKVKSGPL